MINTRIKAILLIVMVTQMIDFGARAEVVDETHFVRHACTLALKPQLPIVAQESDCACGIACLRSVLAYWGLTPPSESELAQQVGLRNECGILPLQIVQAAQARGLFAQTSTQANLGALSYYVSRGETVFVGWKPQDSNHFSLVQAITPQQIVLMDPWYARDNPERYRVLDIEEFITFWARLNYRIIRVSY